MVWPSGSALATTPAPMVPPAPGRFSITNDCPNCSERRCATVRAMMSVALPAVNGTMTETRLLGQDCADAEQDSVAFEMISAATAASHSDDGLIVSPLFQVS